MESSRQRYFYFPLKRIFLENSEEKNKCVLFFLERRASTPRQNKSQISAIRSDESISIGR